MFRVLALSISLLVANSATAGDLLSMAFEETEFVMGGRKVRCKLYYVLLGDNGNLNTGDLVQIVQSHDDPTKGSVSTARFSMPTEKDELTIYWKPSGNEVYGQQEKGRFRTVDKSTNRYRYQIFQHDDKSQIGESLRVRLVDFNQLPREVRDAVTPHILAKASPEERLLYHLMQAEQLKATQAIIDAYLD